MEIDNRVVKAWGGDRSRVERIKVVKIGTSIILLTITIIFKKIKEWRKKRKVIHFTRLMKELNER